MDDKSPTTRTALTPGDRVELWLAVPASQPADGEGADSWDVRSARVVAVTGARIDLTAGGWGLHEAALVDSRVIVRRLHAAGIAEWDGTLTTVDGRSDGNQHADAGPEDGDTGPEGAGKKSARSRGAAVETNLAVQLDPGAGRFFQRRRSPRVALRLSPVRLVPVPNGAPATAARRLLDQDSDLAPVARLSDISAVGAGVVVDTPLEAGETVAVEFELPGEPTPFTLRGRVVEPATALHGDVQPQPDGLPGFRRGIEFFTTTGSREARRLSTALRSMLRRSTSKR